MTGTADGIMEKKEYKEVDVDKWTNMEPEENLHSLYWGKWNYRSIEEILVNTKGKQPLLTSPGSLDHHISVLF